EVEKTRYRLAEIRANGLTLDGDLHLPVFNRVAEGRVEIVRVSASARRRSAASVEEDGSHPVLARQQREIFLRAEYRPVCPEVATVFGAVRETQHNGLLVAAALQMVTVSLNVVERIHHLGRVGEVFNGFKERYNVKGKILAISQQQFRQLKHPDDIQRRLTIADDVTVTALRAIHLLNFADG